MATSNVVSGVIRDVLSMTKSAVTGTYRGCCKATYAVSIVNSSNTTYYGMTLTDDLAAYVLPQTSQSVTPMTYVPDSLTLYVNGVETSGQLTVVETDPLTITGLTIPAGGNVLLLYSTSINQYAPQDADASLTNTASLTGEGVTQLSAQAVITADTTADLSVLKSMSPETIAENEPVTYTFTIFNYGTSATVSTDDVVLRDTFDPILTLQSVTLNATPLTSGVDYTYDALTGQFATIQGQLAVPGATATQDPETGAWHVEPGVAVLTVTGTF